MSTYPSRRSSVWRLLAALCLVLPVIAAAAALPITADANANTIPHPTAAATRAIPGSLALAAKLSTDANRAFIAKTKTLQRCLGKHPGHRGKCRTIRRGLRRAGNDLAIAQRRLSKIARSSGSPAPGTTATLGSRTATDGSTSPDAAISHPETPPVSSSTARPPAAESPQPSATFQAGMNAGWVYPGQLDLAAATKLGAKLVRVEFPIEWTPAQLERTIAGYAEIGVRVAPLATFDGRLPTPAEAQSLATWVKAYGPGGTFWAGRSDGQLAIQSIEFGNETSAGYQYGDNAGDPSYTARAQTYAVRLKEAAEAISATGIQVGLLAVTGDWTGDWMNGMFSAVPNFADYVAGWVSHAYGNSWRKTLEEVISQTAAHGAPATIPIDITEWGLASDNSRCLSDNYGWNPCMSYLEAGETLRKTVAEMHAMLGGRLGMFMLYQSRDQQRSGSSSDREEYFGLLQHEGQSKGAYTQAAEAVLAS